MKISRRLMKDFVSRISAAALSLIVALGTSAGVSADEAAAKRLLKAMSDYLAAQKTLSFEYDAPPEPPMMRGSRSSRK